MRRCLSIMIVVCGGLVLGACNKQKLIPNTKVPDTQLNRGVISVVESYRRAMERLDSAAILALVHPGYQDASGTPDATDDLDYNGLKALLSGQFKNTKRVRFQVEYQKVTTKGREAKIETWIDATFVYEHGDGAPRWKRHTDYNRFHLLKENGRWKFISGL